MGTIDPITIVQECSSTDNGIIDVIVTSLKIIETEGGEVLHMLRADAPFFTTFGEIYFSRVTEGNIRAWKRHRLQTQHFSVPSGIMDIVVYDDREDSFTQGMIARYRLGTPDFYALLTIPPMLWYGFAPVNGSALLANCADIPHSPDEADRLDAGNTIIPFSWDLYKQKGVGIV